MLPRKWHIERRDAQDAYCPGFFGAVGAPGAAGAGGRLAVPGALGAPGGLGMPGAAGIPGGLGIPGAPGGAGIPGAPGAAGMAGMAALISSSVAPQLAHAVAEMGFFAPHTGQVMSTSIAAGLKHMVSPLKGLREGSAYSPCAALRPPQPLGGPDLLSITQQGLAYAIGNAFES
jgi:hypothetical protein